MFCHASWPSHTADPFLSAVLQALKVAQRCNTNSDMLCPSEGLRIRGVNGTGDIQQIETTQFKTYEIRNIQLQSELVAVANLYVVYDYQEN